MTVRSSVSDRVFETFGWNIFPQPLFYRARYALRFEIGKDGVTGVVPFLGALDRARTVAAAVFAGSENLKVIITIFADGDTQERDIRRWLQTFERNGFRGTFGALERVNVAERPFYRVRNDPAFDWQTIDHEILLCADIENDPIQIALFFFYAIGADMDFEPTSNMAGCAYIVDFDRAVVMHVYSHLGFDVVATDREVLCPFYHDFEEWLFDYDRARMDAMFAEPPGAK